MWKQTMASSLGTTKEEGRLRLHPSWRGLLSLRI